MIEQRDLAANTFADVVDGFGDEWSRFDQSALAGEELQAMFDDYFSIFPWNKVSKTAVGIDIGCGSGRWARLVAPRVGTLHCVDASADALAVAAKNLQPVVRAVAHIDQPVLGKADAMHRIAELL